MNHITCDIVGCKSIAWVRAISKPKDIFNMIDIDLGTHVKKQRVKNGEIRLEASLCNICYINGSYDRCDDLIIERDSKFYQLLPRTES